jgi:hypothetical protein
MANLIINIIYVLIAVALIVFLDLKYFRDNLWKRLIINILIALVFLAFYYLFIGTL